MKHFTFIFILLFTSTIHSEEIDSTMNKWTTSLIGGFNFSQIAFSNWTKGGQNSLTWTLDGDFDLIYKNGTGMFITKVNAKYGQTKISENDFRTNENEIYMEQIISYRAKWKVDPFISNSILTQITVGFDYSKEPAVKVAGFFDPGYVTQSIGFTYDRISIIKTRLGLAFQETFTNKYFQHTDDITTPDTTEKFKFETGIESVTNFDAKLDDNIHAESKLRLFTRFENLEVWDVRWDNKITAKINSWLNVSLTYNFVFLKSESPDVQMKEAMQMGIKYAFL